MISGDSTAKIDFAIANARKVQGAERPLLGIDRPAYHYDGRKIKCGDDLTEATVTAMRDDAEAFLLVDCSGKAVSLIINDGMGNLRESPL